MAGLAQERSEPRIRPSRRRAWLLAGTGVLAAVLGILAWPASRDDGADWQATPTVLRATLDQTVDERAWMAVYDVEHVAGPVLPRLDGGGFSVRGAQWQDSHGRWVDHSPIPCLDEAKHPRLEFGVVVPRPWRDVPAPRLIVVWLRCL